MYCKNCGHEIADNIKFCKNCGEPVPTGNGVDQQPEYETQYSQAQYVNNPTTQYQPEFDVNSIPEKYRPVSPWAYFGYGLLFAIPCVGFVLLIVFSLSSTMNINLRNYARSYFCLWALSIILSLGFILLGGAGAMMSYLSGGLY